MISWSLFHPLKDLLPMMVRQADYLNQASRLLCDMQETVDGAQWKARYKEIRNLEHQGDALLTEFRERIPRCMLPSAVRSEYTSIAMSLDDSLDVIKGAANALVIYQPAKIDPQLKDLSRLILEESQALLLLIPLLEDVKRNRTAITHQADRVTELEHDADEAYEAYVGYIFSEEPDFREMTKYKNLAELYEKATDTQKRVADCVRILVLRYVR